MSRAASWGSWRSCSRDPCEIAEACRSMPDWSSGSCPWRWLAVRLALARLDAWWFRRGQPGRWVVTAPRPRSVCRPTSPLRQLSILLVRTTRARVLWVVISRDLAWLFPEHELSNLDLRRDSRLILARVLEHGRLRDVRWCVRQYGLPRIHRFFREESHPEISPRTIALWRAALNAHGETWTRSRRSLLSSAAPWPG